VAEVGGVFLVSAVVMMGNVALHQVFKRRYAPLAAAVVLVVACCAFGQWRLSGAGPDGEQVMAAAVQANVPQDQKWRPELAEETLETYVSLSRQALREKAGLVVWPETACTFYLYRSWSLTLKVLKLSLENKADFLVGSPAFVDGRFYNRAYLLSGGRAVGIYDKVHLVPFGEYLPLAGILKPFFGSLTREVSDFSAGNRVEPIDGIGVLICFESIFPDVSRELCLKGAKILVNMSNDAWFKTWSTPSQHLQFACFRAIETRRWVVRAVNHGISAFIDPRGRVVSEIGLLREGVIVHEIRKNDRLTFYVRYGPVLALIWCALALIAALTTWVAGVKAKGR
jgi:apolipoprotein N-acyltransferase